MSETDRKAWAAKVDFAAKRLAELDGKDWDRLSQNSRWWRRGRVWYSHRAAMVIGSANLWDMFRTYEANNAPTPPAEQEIGK